MDSLRFSSMDSLKFSSMESLASNATLTSTASSVRQKPGTKPYFIKNLPSRVEVLEGRSTHYIARDVPCAMYNSQRVDRAHQRSLYLITGKK